MTWKTSKGTKNMNVVTLHNPTRDRLESELACLAGELKDRAEQGAASASITAQLARRIAKIADQLTQT